MAREGDSLNTQAQDIPKQIEEVGMLQQAYESFSQGFTDAMNNTQKDDASKQVEEIGKASFGKLKSTLTDFIMTGKLNFRNLAKFAWQCLFVEMLVGKAIQMAFA